MTDNIQEENSPKNLGTKKWYKWLAILVIVAVLIPNISTFFLIHKMEEMENQMKVLTEQQSAFSEQNSLVQEEVQALSVSMGDVCEAVSGNDAMTTTAEHRVYLTFDDGPSANTDAILDILKVYDVKATFFVNGKEDEASRARLRKIVEEGHAVGMHSYSHDYGEIYSSPEAFSEDLEKIRDYIHGATGVESTMYRFPGGSSNTISKVNMNEFVDVLADNNIVYYDWNISSDDGTGKKISVEKLVENSTTDIGRYKTSIILLHDAVDKQNTVEALPQIIETIRRMEGTEFLPITEETVPIQHVIPTVAVNEETTVEEETK